MATIEELVEGALGELERQHGPCIEHDCCFGTEHGDDTARRILLELTTAARLEALREAIMTAEYHEKYWDNRGVDLRRIEANTIKCDLQATLAATEAPSRG
jgi:hypothetical protein